MARRGRRRFRRGLALALLLPLLILLRPGDWFGGGTKEGGASQPDSRPAESGPRVLPALAPPEKPPEQPQPTAPASRETSPGSAPGAGDSAARQTGVTADENEAREARAEDEAARLLILAWQALREGRLAEVQTRLGELPPELVPTRAGVRFQAHAERLRSRVAQMREEVLAPLREAAAQGDVLALALGLRRAAELSDPATLCQARELCGLPANATAWDPAPLAARWPATGLRAGLKAALDRHVGSPVRAAITGHVRQGSLYRVESDLAVVVAVPEGGGTLHPRVQPCDLDSRWLHGAEAVHWAALLALAGRRDEALLHMARWDAATAALPEAGELKALLR